MDPNASSSVNRRPVTLLLAGQNELLRHGIRHIVKAALGLEVAGESPTADGTLSLARQLKPDMLIVAGALRKGDVIDLARDVKTLAPTPAVLVLASRDAQPPLRDVDQYLHESVPVDEFVAAVARMLDTDRVAQPRLRSPKERSTTHSVPGLTARQHEVLEYLASGLRDREIAERLGISPRTVETHVRHLLLKLGVKTRTQAVGQFLRRKEDEARRRDGTDRS